MSESESDNEDAPDLSGDTVNLSEIEEQIAPESTEHESGTLEESDLEEGIELELGDESVSVGDIYANLITVIGSELIEAHGSGEGFTDGKQLDTTLAKQLELDKYANQVAAKHSMESMTPEQALLLSTAMFFGAIVVSNPEIITNLREVAV